MQQKVKDPIAGLVLEMCDYLALVRTGTPEEIHESALRMQAKLLIVERVYSRNRFKAGSSSEQDGAGDGS